MNELWSYISFTLGAIGTFVWWLGRGWINHVNDSLEALHKSDKEIHDRIEAERRGCQELHLRIERELGLIRGRINGSAN